MQQSLNIKHVLLHGAVIIVAILLALPVVPAQAARPNVHVPANGGWVDSGIPIVAGEPVSFRAVGSALTGPLRDYPDARSGPDGQITDCTMFDGVSPCAMDGVPYGALVGKIGAGGTPFLIGANFTFTPAVDGQLYLAVNDNLPFYADNHGRYVVFVRQ